MDRITNPPGENLQRVLANWFTEAQLSEMRIVEIPGGLSDSRFWKIALGEQLSCLCRHAGNFPRAVRDIRKIHALLEFVHHNGFANVPAPRLTLTGETFVETRQEIYELTNWLIGEVTSSPTHDQTIAAADALARFHNIAAKHEQTSFDVAPGLQQRIQTLEELRAGLLRKISAAVQSSSVSETSRLARSVLMHVESALPKSIDVVQSSPKKIPLQWCLCDCHIGNFLFTGEQVTGILDFVTAARDSVARDLARLVGSVSTHDSSRWRDCLAAYQSQRVLSVDEIVLVFAYHMSGTVGAAANWLRWQFLENHPAADAATTNVRLVELYARLEKLQETESVFSALLRP